MSSKLKTILYGGTLQYPGGDEQNYNGHVLYYYGINGSNFISCTENKNKINIPQTTFEDKDAVNKEYVDSLFAQLNERINNLATN